MCGSSHLPSRHLRGRGRRLLGLRSTRAVRARSCLPNKNKTREHGLLELPLGRSKRLWDLCGTLPGCHPCFLISLSLCRPGLCCPSLVRLCSSSLNVPLILCFFPLARSAPRRSPPPSKPSSSSVHKTNKPKIVPVCNSALESLLFSHFGHESAAHTHTDMPPIG